jgi:hypothetical protein
MSPRLRRRSGDLRSDLLEAPRWSRARLRPRRAGRWVTVGALLSLAAGVLFADGTGPAPDQSSAAGPARVDASPGIRCRPPADTPPTGYVGFPLRLTDPAPLAVVHAGQHIDVLAGRDSARDSSTESGGDGTSGGPKAARVATDVTVLRTVRGSDDLTGVLYLAVTGAQAEVLARLDAHAPVFVTVRSPN